MDESVLKHQALTMWMHGQKHHLRGDLERAIELYTKSLGLYPTAEAYTFRGWAFSFAGAAMAAAAAHPKMMPNAITRFIINNPPLASEAAAIRAAAECRARWALGLF